MGWFENQIEERRDADEKLLQDAFVKVAGVVIGERGARMIDDERIITKGAIDEILKYYHLKAADLPDSVNGIEAQMDYLLRPHGILRREVELEPGWYQDGIGALLAFMKEDDLPVALIPGMNGGYSFRDPETGHSRKVTGHTAAVFKKDAVCFYRPLPQKSLTILDLLLYIRSCFSLHDFARVLVSTVAVTLVGLLMPRIVRLLTGPVLTSGMQSALIGVAIAIVGVSLSSQLITSINAFASGRIVTKVSLNVEAAMMMRLLSLPADFFRQYSPGELRTRSASVGQLCSTFVDILMNIGFSSLSSLLYITQIFSFAPALVVPSVLIVLVTLVFSVVTTLVQTNIQRRHMEHMAKESGMSYALITGVQKLKLSGAEKRAFAKWLDLYAEGAALEYNPPMFIRVNSVISTAISLFSTMILYYVAVKSGVGQADYFAFTAAYTMLMGAFMSLSDIALTAARIRPVLEMAEPFLKTVPETAADKEIVTTLSGRIELEHVHFRYNETMPYVLQDLSLKIRPGEYIAIVGRTGCGKSTLVRLLLGFEKPEKGAIYYDGKDLERIDLPSLRKQIGTVMQDAGLFQGDVYSNIVITAPSLTLDDAWEAAETAGIAEDIRAMPMGMHTIVSEGQGGISGGQRQRLMIARAIAPKPNLLIFDEATSALDNRTQREVSEALDAMGCTRIVIAHRLSTIRHCDRIIVLEEGRIIEDGTYDALIEKNGYFAALVERQRIT